VRTRAECASKEQRLILDVVGETGEELDEIVELDRVIAVVGSPRAINIYRTAWKVFHNNTNQQAMPVHGAISLTVKRKSHRVTLGLGSTICVEEVMVVGCGLSAPLGRVVQAEGSIVKRYVHCARGESSCSEKRTGGGGEEGGREGVVTNASGLL
jgi:hypothetical protein